MQSGAGVGTVAIPHQVLAAAAGRRPGLVRLVAAPAISVLLWALIAALVILAG